MARRTRQQNRCSQNDWQLSKFWRQTVTRTCLSDKFAGSFFILQTWFRSDSLRDSLLIDGCSRCKLKGKLVEIRPELLGYSVSHWLRLFVPIFMQKLSALDRKLPVIPQDFLSPVATKLRKGDIGLPSVRPSGFNNFKSFSQNLTISHTGLVLGGFRTLY